MIQNDIIDPTMDFDPTIDFGLIRKDIIDRFEKSYEEERNRLENLLSSALKNENLSDKTKSHASSHVYHLLNTLEISRRIFLQFAKTGKVSIPD